MSDIEWRAVTPEEMIQEIEEFVHRSHENKYAYQVGLKDVDFEIDEDRLEVLGLTLPFRRIDQAEAQQFIQCVIAHQNDVKAACTACSSENYFGLCDGL